jgi:hypothetical protein
MSENQKTIFFFEPSQQNDISCPMSALSSLNAPPLVATAGVGTLLLLPVLEKLFEDHGAITWGALKAINACAYAINLIAVQALGRIDGQSSMQSGQGENDQNTLGPSKEMEPLSTGRNGRTLVAPAGW